MSDLAGPARADLELDCLGQRCPLPIIAAARALPALPIGAVLSVLADDPAARTDFPAWCRMREQDYLGERSGAAGQSAYWIRRRH